MTDGKTPNLSDLKMTTVLGDIDTWINQPGHEQEIVWLDMSVTARTRTEPGKAICEPPSVRNSLRAKCSSRAWCRPTRR